MKLWMMAAILFCGAGCLVSCNGNKAVPFDDAVATEAVAQYMVDSLGAHYAQGEVCIPSVSVIAIEKTNPDSIKLWGDYWVFNYNIVGDTLKCVSGGSHPGKMVLRTTDNGYEVIAFEQVADGEDYLESAKRIFGESLYDQFHAINSNEEIRESCRANYIANYVKEHNLPVKYYQDYGWPAKEIPEKQMNPKN